MNLFFENEIKHMQQTDAVTGTNFQCSFSLVFLENKKWRKWLSRYRNHYRFILVYTSSPYSLSKRRKKCYKYDTVHLILLDLV